MLDEYNKKRNFGRTPEPPGNTKRLTVTKSSKFVVQKHDASRLHYDFRLEDTKERVLKSWAVPKGISLNPKIKRLAVLTEDHPLDYLLFEGVIPQRSYDAGTVIVWDTDSYTSAQEISDQYKKRKRIVVLTEDDPLDYLLFEGVIPQGSYSAGTVIVWDTGTYTSEQEISDQFKKGKITFTLFGHKLKGKFTLVRTHLDRGKEG